MSDLESRLRDAETAAGARITDAKLVFVVDATSSRARRMRRVRTVSTIAAAGVGLAACGVVGWWALSGAAEPGGTLAPDATWSSTHDNAQVSQGFGIQGLPSLLEVSPDLVTTYLDATEGPAMVTGAMPLTVEYGDAAYACGPTTAECDHPYAPPVTQAVLDGADERWAVALYSQAWSGMGPGSTGGGGGVGPAGLYLVGPSGESYFVAAGDPATAPIFDASAVGVAWAPGRESAVVGGSLSIEGSGVDGGFTLINLLSGHATTVFPSCGAVQAVAQAEGWLLRATCPGGSVAAVVTDVGELVTTEGLLVADDGVAVNVGAAYLIYVQDNDEEASAYFAITPAGDAEIPGDYCYPTNLGASVVCSEGGELTVTEISDDAVMILRDDPRLASATDLQICTLDGVEVRRTGTYNPDYSSALTVGPSATPISPDDVRASQDVECAAAGGGVGYFAGQGGVWAFDSATFEIRAAIEAPRETFEVTDDWLYPGFRVVAGSVVVGGPSFIDLS